jgi:hypothetical protein
LNAAAKKIRRRERVKNSKGKKDAGKTAVKREAQGRSRCRAPRCVSATTGKVTQMNKNRGLR